MKRDEHAKLADPVGLYVRTRWGLNHWTSTGRAGPRGPGRGRFCIIYSFPAQRLTASRDSISSVDATHIGPKPDSGFLRDRLASELKMHVLIVEDNRALADLLLKGLASRGHHADVSATGVQGLSRARRQIYDALILDLTLPDLDGLEIAARLRSEGNQVPILMLTARDTLDDRLTGFGMGADDYLIKPVAFEEVLARLQAVTRRGPLRDTHYLVVGDLSLDRDAHEVHRSGRAVHLSEKEFALLEYLMQHPGRPLSKARILERVWGHPYDSFANVVEVTVGRLRKALGDSSQEPLIQTVRGVGYRLRS